MKSTRTAWLGLALALVAGSATGACQKLVGIEETLAHTPSGGSGGQAGMASDASTDGPAGSAGAADAGDAAEAEPDADSLIAMKCDWQVPSVRRVVLDNGAWPPGAKRWNEAKADSWQGYLVVALERGDGPTAQEISVVFVSEEHGTYVATIPAGERLRAVKAVTASDGVSAIGVVTMEMTQGDGGMIGRYVLREYREAAPASVVDTTILSEYFEVYDQYGSTLVFDADQDGITFLAHRGTITETMLWSGQRTRTGGPVAMQLVETVAQDDKADLRPLTLFKAGDTAWGGVGSFEGEKVTLVEVPSDSAPQAHPLASVAKPIAFELLDDGNANVAFLSEFDTNGVKPLSMRLGSWAVADFANLEVDQLNLLGGLPLTAMPVTDLLPVFDQGALLLLGGRATAIDTLSFLWADTNGNLRSLSELKVADSGAAIRVGAAGWQRNAGIINTTFNVAWVERSGSGEEQKDVLLADVLRCLPEQ